VIQSNITSELINPDCSPYRIATTDAPFLVPSIVALLPRQRDISVRNMSLCDLAFHWLNAWLYFPSFYVGTRHGRIYKCTKCMDANGQTSRAARRYSCKEAVNIIRYIEPFKNMIFFGKFLRYRISWQFFLRFSSCCMYTYSDIADTNDLNRPAAGILKCKRSTYKRIINAFLWLRYLKWINSCNNFMNSLYWQTRKGWKAEKPEQEK